VRKRLGYVDAPQAGGVLNPHNAWLILRLFTANARIQQVAKDQLLGIHHRGNPRSAGITAGDAVDVHGQSVNLPVHLGGDGVRIADTGSIAIRNGRNVEHADLFSVRPELSQSHGTAGYIGVHARAADILADLAD